MAFVRVNLSILRINQRLIRCRVVLMQRLRRPQVVVDDRFVECARQHEAGLWLGVADVGAVGFAEQIFDGVAFEKAPREVARHVNILHG